MFEDNKMNAVSPCEISILNIYEVRMHLQTGLGPSAGTFKAISISTITNIICTCFFSLDYLFLFFPLIFWLEVQLIISSQQIEGIKKIQLQTGLGPSAGTFNGSWDMKAINSLGGNRWSLMSSTSLCWLLAHESRDVFQAETKITLVSLPNLAILSEKTIIFVVVFPQSHFLCENVPCFKVSSIFTTYLRGHFYIT